MSSATLDQSVVSGVDATNRTFEEAYNRGDAAGAAAVYSSDGQALPPNGSTVSGQDALANFWQGAMDAGIKRVTLETVELAPLGEMAYEVGQANLYAADDSLIDAAKFIVVWKQEAGQWKWHRDIWNSNIPAG